LNGVKLMWLQHEVTRVPEGNECIRGTAHARSGGLSQKESSINNNPPEERRCEGKKASEVEKWENYTERKEDSDDIGPKSPLIGRMGGKGIGGAHQKECCGRVKDGISEKRGWA